MKVPSVLSQRAKNLPGIRSYVLTSVAVLALGLAITFLSWHIDRQRLKMEKSTFLSEQADSFNSDISNRLEIYKQVLKGAGGLFLSSDKVSSDEWKRFIQQYNIEKAYPGISEVGYSEYVPAPALAGFVESVRAEGFPGYGVLPAGSRTEYAPVKYVEPFKPPKPATFGFDMMAGPSSQALIKARDSGDVTLSKKISLDSIGGKKEDGFLMVSPIYDKSAKTANEADRRNAIRGYVYGLFKTDSFFNKSINGSRFKAFNSVQIFDGNSTDKNALLYQNKSFNDSSNKTLTPLFTSKLIDREWSYRFADPIQSSSAIDINRSSIILFVGALLSLVVAGFLFLVMLTRERELIYLKQKEAQQAKDDLLSLASHQLRTPATAVKQFIGMVIEGYVGKINSKTRSFLHKAYISNERQLETINQILYVAKADAGRLSIAKEKIDLSRLINDIVAEMMDKIEDNNQNLIFRRPKRKIIVYADPSSLRMVIENLVSNAYKYSYANATIEIKIGIKKDEVYISVKDQGVGIAEEDFEMLFQKFSRIHNDLSLQAGGSGIGLYIDKILIELHGGRIEVQSEIGKGSTFTLYLPKSSRKRAKNLTD